MERKGLIHKEQLVAWLLRGARAGASMSDCSDMVGISAGTITTWLQRGRDAVAKSQLTETNVPDYDFAYAKFFADWSQARSEARVNVLEDLRDHHDWRAKVQWLVHTSDDYVDVDKKHVEITGAKGGPIEMSQLILAAVSQLDRAEATAAFEKREEFMALENGDTTEPLERSVDDQYVLMSGADRDEE